MQSPSCWVGSQLQQHQHGRQQGKNGVELNDTAEDQALGPVVGLLGQDVDGTGGHAALGDGGQQAADSHGHAGGKERQALLHGHGAGHGGGVAHEVHADEGEEPHDHAVQALGTGEQLQDHDLTGLGWVLAQKAGTGLAGDAGALRGADAAQADGQAGAQQSQRQAAKRFQKTHD